MLEKAVIEDVFKHVKSFLQLRPFYVYTPAHVRAVYSICILAYCLNKDLAERRHKLTGVNYLNSKNLYEPFENGDYATIRNKLTQCRKSEPVELNPEQIQLLKELHLDLKLPKKIM